jgi:cellulose synthase/poly-beta-1,6-N-acetylglucosamine synthase-like glycosyltransferase
MNVCIVIPAYNEEKLLGRAIRSAVYAGISPDDIYVFDDGSKDHTAAVAHRYEVNVRSAGNAGKAIAIQNGIQYFRLFDRYEWLTILDADSLLDKDYFHSIGDATVRYPECAAVCGAPRSQRGNWLTAFRAVETTLSTCVYREAQHLMGAITVAPGCATTYRTAAFRHLDFGGGTLTEDMDWTVQFQRKGEQVVQAHNALVYTQDPLTLGGFRGQVMRWYRGLWQVVRLHRLCRQATKIDAEFALVLGEALIFGAILALLPLWLVLFPGKTLMALAMDQAIFFGFTILTAVREKRWDVIYSFPLYLIPRIFGYALFISAFILERRKSETRWYSPARY